MTEPRQRGPLDSEFENGYRPIDEPPGCEEAEYQRWLAAGGKVLSPEQRIDAALANMKLRDAAPALLKACKELFSLVVMPGNFTAAHRQLILEEARVAMKAAE